MGYPDPRLTLARVYCRHELFFAFVHLHKWKRFIYILFSSLIRLENSLLAVMSLLSLAALSILSNSSPPLSLLAPPLDLFVVTLLTPSFSDFSSSKRVRLAVPRMSTSNENDANGIVATSTPSANGERRSKKPSSRPSMQIYRPPGLRSSDENQQAKPLSAAGAKQPKTDTNEPTEENNNEKTISSDRTESSSPLSNSSISSPSGNGCAVLKRNDSNVSNTSQRSQHRASPPVVGTKNAPGSTSKNPHRKEQTALRPANPQKKKAFGTKEIEEIAIGFKQLSFAKESANIEQFLNGKLENVDLAQSIAQSLVQFAIEESRINGKNVARLSAQVMDSPSGAAFHTGLVTSVTQYFDCRSQLRVDHFRVWIAFLNFVSDLYANLGFTYQGELVNVVFQIFDFMLKAPVLEALKIEELECLIGALLSVGYDLERHCPDQLGVLKDLIRDALIEVHEPWARKMILLLMELCASSWKLPADATDYYFQHTSS